MGAAAKLREPSETCAETVQWGSGLSLSSIECRTIKHVAPGAASAASQLAAGSGVPFHQLIANKHILARCMVSAAPRHAGRSRSTPVETVRFSDKARRSLR